MSAKDVGAWMFAIFLIAFIGRALLFGFNMSDPIAQGELIGTLLMMSLGIGLYFNDKILKLFKK